MNGLEYPNKPMMVFNGKDLVQTAVRGYGEFKLSKVYDGSLNEQNQTNETAYVLDAGTLQNLDLPFQGSSQICSNGTGADCDLDYNKRNTSIKGQSSTTFAQQDSFALNLALTGTNTP